MIATPHKVSWSHGIVACHLEPTLSPKQDLALCAFYPRAAQTPAITNYAPALLYPSRFWIIHTPQVASLPDHCKGIRNVSEEERGFLPRSLCFELRILGIWDDVANERALQGSILLLLVLDPRYPFLQGTLRQHGKGCNLHNNPLATTECEVP